MSKNAKTKTSHKNEILISTCIALVLIVLGLLVAVLNNTARTRLDDTNVVTLTGKAICLEPKNQDGPVIDLCAQGIETEDGKRYALGVTAETKDENTIIVRGVIKPVDQGDTYKSDGIVTNP